MYILAKIQMTIVNGYSKIIVVCVRCMHANNFFETIGRFLNFNTLS